MRSGRQCFQHSALEIYRHFDNSVVGCCSCFHGNRLLKMGHVSLNWSYLHTNSLLLFVKSWNEFKICFSCCGDVMSCQGTWYRMAGTALACGGHIERYYIYKHFIIFFYFYFFGLLSFFFRAIPVAYGGSQAKGQIGATAASLHHSHSNARSKPRLWPTP